MPSDHTTRLVVIGRAMCSYGRPRCHIIWRVIKGGCPNCLQIAALMSAVPLVLLLTVVFFRALLSLCCSCQLRTSCRVHVPKVAVASGGCSAKGRAKEINRSRQCWHGCTTPSPYSLDKFWIFTESSLNIFWVCAEYTMIMVWLCSECILNKFWICFEMVLNTSWIYYESSMHMFWIYSEYSLNKFWIYYESILNMFWIYPECILITFWMHSE